MLKYFCVGTYVYDPERNHLEIYLRRGEKQAKNNSCVKACGYMWLEVKLA